MVQYLTTVTMAAVTGTNGAIFDYSYNGFQAKRSVIDILQTTHHASTHTQ